ncbi:MAG TPA: hypothetical protein DEF42_13085 [Desulfosporosinus sp.]|nr:hypothetical protein [Desulfosporosinus sp.]
MLRFNIIRAVLLILASCLLYAGGVALNDVIDVEKDQKEGSERLIPSGQISIKWQGGYLSPY